MGGSSSKNTPLDCFPTNFKLAFSPEQEDEYGMKFSRGKLRTLCNLEWPAFGGGWPAEVSFEPRLCRAVWAKVIEHPGHPDQFPYITIWAQACEEPPAWLQHCSLRTSSHILVMVPNGIKSAKRQAPRPVFSQEPDPLEPTDPRLRPPPHAEPSPGEAEVKSIYPSPPKEGEIPDSTTSPSRTRGGSAYGPTEVPQERPDPVPVLPLREIEQGHYVYISFSTSDLYNLKHQNPLFSEKPQALISLLESVFNTHDPTWDDCQQLLQALLTSEERERIRRHAIQSVLGGAEGLVDDQQQQARVEAQLPISHPKRESNSKEVGKLFATTVSISWPVLGEPLASLPI
ncbi:uncharacterized protein LOC109117790 [Fukomys damarensis]|uniref:uncharacterized protein LOC109117790 n=1 Tax=Fukomys damarensis TaxID=885580 RepID=UPI0008FF561D|nr:uncharacterized protein LOC109117790 [Fukomys damarensis]XP_019061811.1 uncharacterized protein LOC109117790 [Fukomys damarensis]XP_019061812.1 uncharacterized protein LOC109117790 [Fukomys damarensis]